MKVDLTDSVAIVTGAGRGNGRAIARALAENGAAVVVNDIDEGPAETTAQLIREEGGKAHAIAADVSDESAVKDMVTEAEETFGTVSILVNNAGVSDAEAFVSKPDDELWELNLDTNLWGAIYCSKHTFEGMIEEEYGKIINITSIHTKGGVGFSPQYDVGKYSLLGFTKTMAMELGRFGIRVNAVAPGHTNTRMTEDFSEARREQITDLNPLGRFAESEEIADAVAFLASPASDYINGHELRVDGGQRAIDAFKSV